MVANRDWFGSMFIAVLVPCAVFRFVVFAPFGYYWAYASTHWKVIKNNAELHNGLYNPTIATGEKIASNWGTFAFYWNFAVWIPTFYFPPPLNLPFTIIDTVTTIYLARATHYQTSYVPHSKGSCITAAYDWHRPAGANESFFQAAGRLNATVATPVKMCRTFVEEWQYGIALSFFYALISLLNIIAFFGALSTARRQGESVRDVIKALLEVMLVCLLSIPKFIGLILLGFLWYLPEVCFRCLPLSLKSKVRFGRRYALKSGLGLEQKTELGVTELKNIYEQNKRKRGTRYQGGPGTESPLSKFLGIYDMLIIVTEELHYTDILNLSRVSKSIREVVLPTHDFDRRIEIFKRYSCSDALKTVCWICDTQICTKCQQIPLVPEVTLFHHIHNCSPYCTPCYQTIVVTRRPPYSTRLKAPHCSCAPVTGHPNVIMRWWNGPTHYTSKQAALRKVPRAVCRACNMYTAQELLEMGEVKIKNELKRGLKRGGEKWTKCARIGCGRELGTGPRWWVCGIRNCEKECRSIVHQGWGRGEKGNGIVVGEEVV